MARRALILSLAALAIVALHPVAATRAEWIKPAVGKWIGKTSRDTRISFTVARKPGSEKRRLPKLRWTVRFYGPPDPFAGDCPRTYTFVWPAPDNAPYYGDDPIPVRKTRTLTYFDFSPWEDSVYRLDDYVQGVFPRKRRAKGTIFMDGGVCWETQTMTWRAHRRR